MATTMTHAVLEPLQLLLCVHNDKPPNDKEWDAYMSAFRTLDIDKARQLVYTGGGGPNSKQRDGINGLVRGRKFHVAVVTPSRMVFGICTALSWFNPEVKAFSPDQMSAAFKHIGISEAQQPIVYAALRKLGDQIGDPALKTMAATS
jgi:hypothetical protein